jgi:Xaa-Pro aminopeptidase
MDKMNRKSIENRLEQVRKLMKDQDLPALIVMQADNRRYLSGFTGDSGGLMITQQHAILSTDSRYWEQAEQQSPDFVLHKFRRSMHSEWLPVPRFLEMAGDPKRAAIEAATMTLSAFEELQSILPNVEWIKTIDLIEQVRAVKDADELASIQKAIDLAEEGFLHLMQHLRPGMTELEAAWILEVYLREHGSEGLGFDSIVAAGPNGAMAHHEPSNHMIQANEPIIIDWGARIDGYRSDNTRTIVLGEGDAKYHEVYNIVKQAEEIAIAKVTGGMTGKAADALSRDVIVAAGYGDNFGHSLGHGVGLAIHEEPRLSQLNDDVLPSGSVVTIEPAIYIPGWGGVRLEDMVLLQDDGSKLLTDVVKNPVMKSE